MINCIGRDQDANRGRAAQLLRGGLIAAPPVRLWHPLPSLRLASSLPIAAITVEHVSKDPSYPHGIFRRVRSPAKRREGVKVVIIFECSVFNGLNWFS